MSVSSNSSLEVENDPVDLLGRQKIIDDIIRLLDTIKKVNGSCTFALNGNWGCGKTFALSKLQRQLLKNNANDYLVLYYNCWQYDYYDEPLLAIVAAILNCIEKETNQHASTVEERASISLAIASTLLKRVIKGLLKSKLGLDDDAFSDLEELTNEGSEAIKEAIEKIDESRDFDPYDPFKKAMEDTKKSLLELAAARTIVVIVDELDRCLPNYAIKVLERLHHLFDGLNNSVVILAVDKRQLENTVKQIYGYSTKTDAYLRKFIKFELSLGTGTIVGPFQTKYASYFSQFDKNIYPTDFDFNLFLSNLFSGIDARTQERLMERIETAHRMVLVEKKRDYVFMCFELLWLILNEYYAQIDVDVSSQLSSGMPIAYESDQLCVVYPGMKQFEAYIRENWGTVLMSYERGVHSDQMILSFDQPTSVQHYLMWYLQEICSISSSEGRWQCNEDLTHLSELKSVIEILTFFR